jgi:sortase A
MTEMRTATLDHPVPRKIQGTRVLILRAAYYFFLACGVGSLGYSGYVFADAHRYQAQQPSAFEESRSGRTSLAQSPRIFADGGTIGEMEIPRLEMKLIVAQGDSPATLQRAVGHVSNSALPGESGNVILAAHRDSFFRPLRNVRSGDVVTVKTLDAEYEYKVASTAIVSPDDLETLQATSKPMLTLITCYPFYYIGAAPKRFVVRARLIEARQGPSD